MSDGGNFERELYSTVESYLNVDFAPRLKPRLGTSLPLVQIVATQGPAGSGIWSRPDLALVNLWRHKYQPTSTLDLYGFEVKRDGGCDVRSVHEALAHRRFVHFAYLVWQYSSSDFSAPAFETIRENCAAYGLGLITFSHVADGRSFIVHQIAQRSNPADAEVDAFIDERFPEEKKQRLLRWLGELG